MRRATIMAVPPRRERLGRPPGLGVGQVATARPDSAAGVDWAANVLATSPWRTLPCEATQRGHKSSTSVERVRLHGRADPPGAALAHEMDSERVVRGAGRERPGAVVEAA